MADPRPSPPRNTARTVVSACSELPRVWPSARAQATSCTRPAQPESAKTNVRARGGNAVRVTGSGGRAAGSMPDARGGRGRPKHADELLVRPGPPLPEDEEK